MRPLAILFATALVAAGCGVSGKSPDGVTGGIGTGPGAEASDCEADSSLSAAAAFTGTRTAPAAAASHGTADDVGAVLVSAQSGMPFLSGWSFTFVGEPRLTTYTEGAAGVGCGATVADSVDPNRAWVASKGVQGMPDQGTCSVTLTAVIPTLVLSAQTQYCVHGTMQATLPASPGSTATGSVTLTAAF